MTLRHFKIFVTVCDTMNMTEAAELLYMSQSAVSQAISDLEKFYDVRLFERLSRKLYLTRTGEKLLSYSRHMIRMNDTIEKDMKAIRQNGLIRIGASVTVGTTLLPGLAAEFGQLCPESDIEVFEDNTEQIEKRLLNDKTDIGIVEGDLMSPDIKNIPFMDDELMLICSPKHRFAKLNVVNQKELENENFIIREQGSGTRKTFENEMAAHELNWKVIWTCNNADTIKAAVIAGLGISVISKRAVSEDTKAGKLLLKPVDGIRFRRKFKIAYHKNKYLTQAMKNFIDLCKSRS